GFAWGRKARILEGMKGDSSPYPSHLSGEQSLIVAKRPPEGVDLDSFFGPVRVEWDHEAAMTPLGQLPFFIDFLKTAGLFDALVADCPLRYLSPNAPRRRDVLGTVMLSMLAGHRRYAHIAALRCDAVLPELLGMKKIVSEDAIRRAFKAIDETEGAVWLRRHLQYCVETLLVLDVDVGPGDEHASQTAGRVCGGSLIVCRATYGPRFCGAIAASATRGSCARRRRGSFRFLLKLRLTANVKRMIEK